MTTTQKVTPQKISPWRYYRKMGFSLFPAGKDKKPAVTEWKKYQTRFPTDKEIAAWERAKYNIAIVTGKLSNLLVIDTDNAKATAEFEELLGDLFEAPIVKTPRGGRHYYFRLDSRFPSNKTLLGESKKIDIRSEGGYVLAPKSRTKDGAYTWTKNSHIMKITIPELVPDMAAHRLLATMIKPGQEEKPGPRLIEGRRDNDLFLSACKLKDQGLDQETVEAMIKVEARMCRPPFSEAEAVRKVKSAFSRPATVRRKEIDRSIPMSLRMSDVKEEDIKWLWRNYIPSESITLINGDPDAGKSWWALDLASRVTRGAIWPDGTRGNAPANVYYMTYEDVIAKQVKKRIRTLGADQDRFFAFNSEYPLNILLSEEEGRKHLESELIRLNIVNGFLVIDPILDFTGSLNPNAVELVRPLLTPLVKMAKHLSLAIAMVGHLNKDQMKIIMYRSSGSTGGWQGKARAAFLIARENEGTHVKRYVFPVKNNWAWPEPVPMEFEIIDSKLIFKLSDIDASSVLNPIQGRPPVAKMRAKEIVADMFRERDEIPATEVEERTKLMGISKATRDRVKKEEGYTSDWRKSENEQSPDYWVWKKPYFKK